MALERTLRRGWENPVWYAYADRRPEDVALGHTGFDWVCVDAPWIEVDTTEGYPGTQDGRGVRLWPELEPAAGCRGECGEVIRWVVTSPECTPRWMRMIRLVAR